MPKNEFCTQVCNFLGTNYHYNKKVYCWVPIISLYVDIVHNTFKEPINDEYQELTILTYLGWPNDDTRIALHTYSNQYDRLVQYYQQQK